ncbi:MAG: hypothetical protein IT374_16180 [Polyangiaceae bacterium]|nr:hypothetical protein [Polyangiaceae bacterium]
MFPLIGCAPLVALAPGCAATARGDAQVSLSARGTARGSASGGAAVDGRAEGTIRIRFSGGKLEYDGGVIDFA